MDIFPFIYRVTLLKLQNTPNIAIARYLISSVYFNNIYTKNMKRMNLLHNTIIQSANN